MKRRYLNFKSVMAIVVMCCSYTFVVAQGGIIATPAAGCNGADGVLSLEDPGGVTYDVDIYAWDPAAMQVLGGPVNIYSGNPTPDITITQDDPMGCDCEDAPAVDLYYVPWQDPFNGPADGTLISTGHVTSSCPELTETVVAPDCAGTVPSVTITAPDGTICFTQNGVTGEDPATTCPTDPVDGALSYAFTAFAGTDCETEYTMDLQEICSCTCPVSLGTYVDPNEMICGAGLPSNLPTLADLVDAPAGATLVWTPDPTDPANNADASGLGCGNTDTVVFTGEVTCNLDNSVIVTVTYTLTDECPVLDCGGDLCDMGSLGAFSATEVCAGSSVTIDVGAISGATSADVDVYAVGSDGSCSNSVNVYSSFPSRTLTVTPEPVQGCDPVDVTYTGYVVCWQDAFDCAAPVGLVEFDLGTVTVYPELTEVIVEPDCAGTLPSVEITSPDGTVCFTMTGTAGEDPATTCPTDPLDGALSYDETFFAGTACEVTFTMDLTSDCTCTCPVDLGTYVDPMEVLCVGPGVPSMLPVLADLVDVPDLASLTWDIDPTVTVDPQSCDPQVVVYTGDVNCSIDGSDIVEVLYTFTVYPELTVAETSPDCAGEAGLVEITSPDGTVCFTMTGTTGTTGDCATHVDGELSYTYTAFAGTTCETVYSNDLVEECGVVSCGGPLCDIEIITSPLSGCPTDVLTIEVHDVNAMGDPSSYNPPYDVDVYLFEGTTNLGLLGNLFTTSAVDIDITVDCDPVDYTIEVVCWQDAVGDPGTNELSIPFTVDVDPTCVDPTPTFVSGPEDGNPGCVDDDCAPLSNNVITFSCPDGYEAFFSNPINATYANFVDNMDGTYSIEILPICNQGDGMVEITVDCLCGDGTGGSTFKSINDDTKAPVEYECPFGFGTDCMAEPLLPIELLSFGAVKEGAYNRISWSTASEINNEFQIIERSADGVNEWVEIGKHQGHSYSFEVNEYTILDRNPLATSFYRLKAVDFDGFTETSEIVVVRRGDTNLEFALTAAPNPFTNSTELTIHSSYDTEMLLTVTDITGKVIFTSNVFTKKGVSSISIDGSDFDTGIYFVNIDSAQNSSTIKLIKH